MPEMDGYEALRRIKEDPTLTHIPVIIVALTAHAMPGSREASLAAGMNDQFTKPLTMVALTGMLLKWLAPSTAHASGEIRGAE